MAFDFSELRGKFDTVAELVGGELKTIKTGRAKPALVEDVRVEAYGAGMPLKELGSISAPDPNLITVQVWDQSVIAAVEKALSKAGFNPAVDGQLIRITIAALTGEKREEMIKQVAQQVESGRQMIRAERTNMKKDVEEQKGQAGVSEDDIANDLEKLEEITGEYMKKLEEMGEKKEEDLRQI